MLGLKSSRPHCEKGETALHLANFRWDFWKKVVVHFSASMMAGVLAIFQKENYFLLGISEWCWDAGSPWKIKDRPRTRLWVPSRSEDSVGHACGGGILGFRLGILALGFLAVWRRLVFHLGALNSLTRADLKDSAAHIEMLWGHGRASFTCQMTQGSPLATCYCYLCVLISCALSVNDCRQQYSAAPLAFFHVNA